MKHSIVSVRSRINFLAAFALVALAGCGGGDDSEKTAGPAPATGNNSAPTIQGQPGGSAMVGQAYSYQPSADDADGDALSFTVSNLPPWASFNQDTGRISGTPDASDIATYSNIRISVSDGEDTASTAPFSITVTDTAVGSVTLSWTPPTQNQDGSALTDLAGYSVEYGRSEGLLNESVQLTNPSLNTYVIDNLSSGTWFFAVRSVNSEGVSSQLSNVTSKTIS